LNNYTVRSWKRRLFDTGSLDKKKTGPKPGKAYKYTPEKIKELLDKNQTPEPRKNPESKTQDSVATPRQTKPKKKKKKLF
jgi:hypothetical protein